jgi:cobaltochelatase CobS
MSTGSIAPPDYVALAVAAQYLDNFEERRALLRAAFEVACNERISASPDSPDARKKALVERIQRGKRLGTLPASTRESVAGVRDVLPVPVLEAFCLHSDGWTRLAWFMNGTKPADEAFETGTPMSLRDAMTAEVNAHRMLDDSAWLDRLTARLGPMSSRKLFAKATALRSRSAAAAPTSTTAATSTTKGTTMSKSLPLTNNPIMLANVFAALMAHSEVGQKVHDHVNDEGIETVTGRFLNWYSSNSSLPADVAKALVGPVSAILSSMTLPAVGDAMSTFTDMLDANSKAILDAFISAQMKAMSADEALTEVDEPSETEATPTVAGLKPLDLTVDATMKPMLDAVLSSAKLPSIDVIVGHATDAVKVAAGMQKRIEELSAEVARAKFEAMSKVDGAAAPTGKAGELPEGEVVMRKAADVFGIKGAAAKAFSFEVPTFKWKFTHPDVPQIDPDYVFRPDMLVTLLLAIVKGQQPWVHGHTGSGKSTLVEQIAARLEWPVKRVNFDSEITRMDLVGRDTLVVDPTSGTTVTKWEDGVLPQALRGPNILLLDEIDFVRPDVSYVMQRIAEGKGLLLNENSGEYVKPHPMFRLFATANTVGQGDEYGMYQGARPQSMAFLDRFFPFVHVGYMNETQERDLIRKRVPAIDMDAANLIAKYVTEHRQAFTNAQVMQPLSPRGIGAVADSYVSFYEILGDRKKALRRAFEDMVLAKATGQDRAVFKGLIDRVLK